MAYPYPLPFVHSLIWGKSFCSFWTSLFSTVEQTLVQPPQLREERREVTHVRIWPRVGLVSIPVVWASPNEDLVRGRCGPHASQSVTSRSTLQVLHSHSASWAYILAALNKSLTHRDWADTQPLYSSQRIKGRILWSHSSAVLRSVLETHANLCPGRTNGPLKGRCRGPSHYKRIGADEGGADHGKPRDRNTLSSHTSTYQITEGERSLKKKVWGK